MNTLSLNLATPEQKIAIDMALSLLAGVQTITPLFYQGVIAGSEFLTYDAKKLYACLYACVSGGPTNASSRFLNVYDETNTLSSSFTNSVSSGQAGPSFTQPNDIKVKALYFSRILSTNGYVYIHFIGYKITIP
jgi:hypothetical protein